MVRKSCGHCGRAGSIPAPGTKGTNRKISAFFYLTLTQFVSNKMLYLCVKKNWLIKDRVSEEKFRLVCKNSKSMAEAAAALGLHFNSFKKRAIELDCYFPNQAGISIRKQKPKIPISDIILKNLHPQYQSNKLRIRLIEEKIKAPICETCCISEWNSKPISLELHHINGNKHDHRLDNLKLLCPSCHSQTKNYRSKNRRVGVS